MRFLRNALGQGYDVQLRMADALPPIIADRSQLEQILSNLSLNAKQAMPGGGVISIATAAVSLNAEDSSACVPYEIRPGKYVELRVEDNGVGMDEATLLRIFDPFFTTRPEGHGLGLAAVLGILRQHNALIRYDTHPGAGTRVFVYFPVASQDFDDAPDVTSIPRRKKRRSS
jgi:signal transduction histidine kinase